MVAGICGGRSVAALGAGAAARLAGAARGDVNAERTVDVAADDDADDDVPMESILATIAGMVGDAAVGGNDKVEAGVRAVAADAGATTGAVAGVSTGVTAGGCAAVAAADVVVAEEEDGMRRLGAPMVAAIGDGLLQGLDVVDWWQIWIKGRNWVRFVVCGYVQGKTPGSEYQMLWNC
nr:unnamed protein product [Digitaria exilis]